jgi:hypothetical protein
MGRTSSESDIAGSKPRIGGGWRHENVITSRRRLQFGLDGRLEALKRIQTGVCNLPLFESVEPPDGDLMLSRKLLNCQMSIIQYVMEGFSNVM